VLALKDMAHGNGGIKETGKSPTNMKKKKRAGQEDPNLQQHQKQISCNIQHLYGS
jgi:hypothetical protein